MNREMWYVRIGEEILGPISEAELRDLALRGGILQRSLISVDKQSWIKAETLPMMVFGQIFSQGSKSQFDASPGTSQNPSNFSSGWLIAGVFIGVIALLFCSGIILVLLASMSVPPTSDVEIAQAESLTANPTYEQVVGHRTFEYWSQVGSVVSDAPPINESHQALVARLRRSAAQIRSLPTANVDTDAVMCVNNLATVMSNVAEVVAQSNDPSIIVESIFRGAAGDPFGTVSEILGAQSLAGQQFEQVLAELANTRAILSARYGVEFPQL